MMLMINAKHNSTDEADFVSGVLCKDLSYWVIVIAIAPTHQSTLTAVYILLFCVIHSMLMS